MKTTLNKIRANSPCTDGWTKLLKHLGKTQSDDEPLSIITVLDSNGLDDAFWCLRAVEGYEKEIRLYAVWCARKVQHLMTDPRSIAALDVAERYAHGQATEGELSAALAEAEAATGGARDAAARSAAWSAARAATGGAWDAAWSAAGAAAWDAAGDAAWSAAEDAREAAGDAAGSAARDAQAQELRRVCAEIEIKGEGI